MRLSPPASDDTDTEQLVTGEPAYMIVPAEPRARQCKRSNSCARSSNNLRKQFGSFLLVEIWSVAAADTNADADVC